MQEEIRVYVIEFKNRKNYMMRYVDPSTGKTVAKSTGVSITGRKREKTEAERVAAKWESDLRNGRYKAASKITWQEFRERYEDEVATTLAEATAARISSVFNMFENLVSPRLLRDANEKALSRFQRFMRENDRSDATIKSHCAHLLASLRWAADQKMIHEAPKVKMPKRARTSKVMKGRPITGEEFERMLTKATAIFDRPKPKEGAKTHNWTNPMKPEQRAKVVASWRHYLRGLWFSGLRLSESLELRWDDGPMAVDLKGRRPMLRIAAEAEKGNRDRILAIAPEFAEFLLATPESERTGYVFNPLPRTLQQRGRMKSNAVCKMVGIIGTSAGIVVDRFTSKKAGEPDKIKFATAHDLRRSFGERWATRIMPQVLMELMRHENIETTMRFYVGRNAERTADVLWGVFESQTGSIDQNAKGEAEPRNENTPRNAGRNE